jgi:hypothetical protein
MTGVTDDGTDRHVMVFEQTYRRHEFSELVRVTILLAEWLSRLLRKPDAAASGVLPLHGETSFRRRHTIGHGPPPQSVGDG